MSVKKRKRKKESREYVTTLFWGENWPDCESELHTEVTRCVPDSYKFQFALIDSIISYTCPSKRFKPRCVFRNVRALRYIVSSLDCRKAIDWPHLTGGLDLQIDAV